ncbi:hypothetical protein ACP70R_045019 [Stipagrostis hirtigluma subsp. patula]
MGDRFLELLLLSPPTPPVDPSPSPASILLDPYGYVSARENDTTAGGVTNAGHLIRVTFWVAAPPRASCFTVHCPALNPSALGDFPTVVTTEEDLALLRVAICRRGDHLYPNNIDYFVYQAGTAARTQPALHPLPTAPDPCFSGGDAVLLPCRDRGMFFVAILRPRLSMCDQFDTISNCTTPRQGHGSASWCIHPRISRSRAR